MDASALLKRGILTKLSWGCWNFALENTPRTEYMAKDQGVKTLHNSLSLEKETVHSSNYHKCLALLCAF